MNNHIETPNSIDIRKLEDFNNFWCYLPTGLYRSRDYINPRREKIIKDLDQIAERLGIDAIDLCNEMRRADKKMSEVIYLIREKNELKEAKEKSEEVEKIRQEVHQKFIPLFEELVKLGYNPLELMS